MYSEVIGVNRAAFMVECDWLMMTDNAARARQILSVAKPLKGYILPPPVNTSVIGALCHDPRQWYPPRTEFRRLSLTGPAALFAARGLGATEIHVYGNDMTGDVYANGEKMEDKDIPLRWSAEPRQWDRSVKWLTEHGTKITFFRSPPLASV